MCFWFVGKTTFLLWNFFFFFRPAKTLFFFSLRDQTVDSLSFNFFFRSPDCMKSRFCFVSLRKSLYKKKMSSKMQPTTFHFNDIHCGVYFNAQCLLYCWSVATNWKKLWKDLKKKDRSYGRVTLMKTKT